MTGRVVAVLPHILLVTSEAAPGSEALRQARRRKDVVVLVRRRIGLSLVSERVHVATFRRLAGASLQRRLAFRPERPEELKPVRSESVKHGCEPLTPRFARRFVGVPDVQVTGNDDVVRGTLLKDDGEIRDGTVQRPVGEELISLGGSCPRCRRGLRR